LRTGKNVIAIVAMPAQDGRGNRGGGGGGRGNAGSPGQVLVTTSPGDWKRSLFSGLAQIIVQSTGQPGEITLTAKARGVTDGVLKIQAQPAVLRPAVAAR
jgi:beta-galactosidase